MTFPALLGLKEKIVSGVVVALAIFFLAVSYDASGGELRHPSFYVPSGILVTVLTLALGFRPIGYTLGSGALEVERPFTNWRLAYAEIRAVRAPAEYPTFFTIGVWRAEGFFGSYGFYWNRPWGLFRVFVTDSKRLVEIIREDGSRVVVSPDDPRGFRDALIARARLAGADVAFAT